MISTVACRHGTKLCAQTARDFRSQHPPSCFMLMYSVLCMYYKTIVFIYFFYVCGSLPFMCCFCKCFCHHVSSPLTYVHASPAHLYITSIFYPLLAYLLCVMFLTLVCCFIIFHWWQCLFCCQQQKHCWSYFFISWTQLVELVTWQRWYIWINASSLSRDLKP